MGWKKSIFYKISKTFPLQLLSPDPPQRCTLHVVGQQFIYDWSSGVFTVAADPVSALTWITLSTRSWRTVRTVTVARSPTFDHRADHLHSR